MADIPWGDASELEKQGKYEEAAAAYAILGFEDIVEAEFQESSDLFIGLGTLLQGVSCDARRENTRRAERLQGIFEYVATDAIEATSKDVVRGLLYEWLGDSLLMTGSADVFEQYSRAEECYQGLDHQTQLQWGLSEEVDYAAFAYNRFATPKGEAVDDDTGLVDFLDRIDQKRAIARRLLADDRSE